MGEMTLAEWKREENRQLDLLPMLPGIVAAAEVWESDGTHRTGKILGKDEELCEQVAAMVLEGKSARRIARTLAISRGSIDAVMEVMERRGKLGPLKERLIREVGRVAELSLVRMREALEDDIVPPAALPIFAGVAIDKRELLTGGVTGRVEIRSVQEPDFEAFNALAVRLLEEKRAREAGAIDVGSIGEGVEVVGNEGESGPAAALATVSATGSGAAGLGPGASAGADMGAGAGAEGGGGGVAFSAAGGGDDSLGQENLSGKGGVCSLENSEALKGVPENFAPEKKDPEKRCVHGAIAAEPCALCEESMVRRAMCEPKKSEKDGPGELCEEFGALVRPVDGEQTNKPGERKMT